MSDRRYSNIVDAITRTPWAIHPAMLAVILDLVSYRVAGGRLSTEEIDERIQPRAAGMKTSYVSGTVAVIPLQGVLMPRSTLFSQISGGTSLQDFAVSLRDAVSNEQVSAILIDCNSPGGSTDMVPETAALLRSANAQKPITAIANTDSASAAYWLASQAGELVCTPSGMVGSVGVYAAHTDLSAQKTMLGEHTTLISAGPYKTELSSFAPLTPEAEAAVQNVVDQYYAMFVNDVARGRGVSSTDVRNGFGQGRMLTASDALAAGMVDRVATFDDTFNRLAGVKPKPGPAARAAAAAALAPVLLAAEPDDVDDPNEDGELEPMCADCGHPVSMHADGPSGDNSGACTEPGCECDAWEQPYGAATTSETTSEKQDTHPNPHDELEALEMETALCELIRKEN
jgi:capsid assembly protease